MNIRDAIDSFLQWIFPPRCISCDELLSADIKRNVALCSECQKLWISASSVQCKECFLPFSDCRCVLPKLKKAGVSAHIKLVPYTEGEERFVVARNVVNKLKRQRYGNAFAFLASELLVSVVGAVEAQERSFSKQNQPMPLVVVTHLPRSKYAVRRHGYDQAQDLAREISRQAGYCYEPLLRRAREGMPQKTLSAAQREHNVKGAFSLVGNPSGKIVLLVDDIVTTGASVSEAASLLLEAGAAQVMVVSVALTTLKK